MSNEKLILNASHFLKYELDDFVSLSGRQRMELKPTNLNNLHSFADDYPSLLKLSEKVTFCVAKAISRLPNQHKKPYQDIFIYYYLEGLYSYEVVSKIGYSIRRYSAFKRQAIVEFTNYFNFYALKYGLASDIELIS